MSSPGPDHLRTALRAALTDAMKRRDRDAASAYRVALGAIDDAEAVPLSEGERAGAIESSPVGVGATEAPRLRLTWGEVADIITREAAARRDAADLLESADQARCSVLRRQAVLLDAIVETARQGYSGYSGY
jgi:uncharacterized protein YqeY